MNIRIEPGPLRGTVQAMPSKSHSHRLLIAAALTGGGVRVLSPGESEDIRATRECLAQLSSESPALPCGESGSTLRFLLPVAMALKEKVVFLGSERLLSRPLSPLWEEMETHGCSFSMGKNRLEVQGSLTPGDFRLPGNVSSQFVTGLLFALPLLAGDSRICLTSPLESAGYVDLTLDVLEKSGIRISLDEENGLPVYGIPGGQTYRCPDGLTPEGDWSNGAVWLAANYVGYANQVKCAGLDESSLQGDRVVLSLLRSLPSHIDVAQIPDLVPVLAVVAALRPGTTVFSGGARLKLKESDRIATVAALVNGLGGQAEALPDGLMVRGKPLLAGGEVSGANDHRIVMAAALASCLCKSPVTILGAEAVNKSYPGFFRDFKSLGGIAYEL